MYGRRLGWRGARAAGAGLLALALAVFLLPSHPTALAQDEVVFENGNIEQVFNGPTNPTVFVLDQPRLVTAIQTYHWNNGRGTTPGLIALVHEDGTVYGPWAAVGLPGMGGVPNAYWEVYPNEVLPAGMYLIVDSDPETWSHNARSDYTGFAVVRAAPGAVLPSPPGACTWTGVWDTNWGRMELVQIGDQVSGTYTHDQGRISGVVRDGAVVGTWSEAPSYQPPRDAGDVVLRQSADCATLSGEWRYGSTGAMSGGWSGTRVAGAVPQPTPGAGPTPTAPPVAGATVEGVVRNAATGQPLAGATVSGAGRTATTDANGRYRLSGLPAGAVELTATAPGFVEDRHTLTVPANGTVTQAFALTQALAAGQMRVVLTWGNNPRDLDSHLWVPTPGQPTEIFYQQRGTLTSAPFANLDVDDTNGQGPETVTIGQLLPGRYTYAVHHYAGDGSIATSGARVVVYQGATAVQTFTPPAGSGRWWTVFTIDGATSAITPVNRLSDTAPGGTPGPGGVSPPTAVPGGVTPTACTWTGTWTTQAPFKSVGTITMTLTQTGNTVTGTYSYQGGRVQGRVEGNALIGTWTEAPTYQPPANGGDLELRLAPDCRSFTGRFFQQLTAMPPGSTGWWEWTGQRGP